MFSVQFDQGGKSRAPERLTKTVRASRVTLRGTMGSCSLEVCGMVWQSVHCEREPKSGEWLRLKQVESSWDAEGIASIR